MSLGDGSNNKATRRRRLHKGAFWMPGASGLGAARAASSKAYEVCEVEADALSESVGLDLVIVDAKLSMAVPLTPQGTQVPLTASPQLPQGVSRAA